MLEREDDGRDQDPVDGHAQQRGQQNARLGADHGHEDLERRGMPGDLEHREQAQDAEPVGVGADEVPEAKGEQRNQIDDAQRRAQVGQPRGPRPAGSNRLVLRRGPDACRVIEREEHAGHVVDGGEKAAVGRRQRLHGREDDGERIEDDRGNHDRPNHGATGRTAFAVEQGVDARTPGPATLRAVARRSFHGSALVLAPRCGRDLGVASPGSLLFGSCDKRTRLAREASPSAGIDGSGALPRSPRCRSRPPTGVRGRRGPLGQAHRLAQPRVRSGQMRDRHRFDEVLLEARLDGRLDLLDAPHERFDVAARAVVEQRDAGAGAGRVAGGADAVEVAIGNHAEHHRVLDVDVAAEGAGERMRSTWSTPMRSISSRTPA